MLLGPPPSPFGHEVCGVDVATGRRVVVANSAPCGDVRAVRAGSGDALREPPPAPQRRLRRAASRARADRAEERSSPSPRARVGGRRDGRAARVLPARRRRRAVCTHGDTVAIVGAGPIGLMLCACVADAGGRPGDRRRAGRSGASWRRCSARRRRAAGRGRRDRGRRHRGGLGPRPGARPARGHRARFRRASRADRASPSTRTGSITRRSGSSARSTTRRATSAPHLASSRARPIRSSGS